MRVAPMLHRSDVVHEENVDSRQAKPLQAVLERAHNRIVGVVEYSIERHSILPVFGCGYVHPWAQQPPDFCRQPPFVTRYFAQRVADTTLRLAKPIKGCGVYVAHSGRPGRSHDRFGLFTADRHPAAPERRAAKTESGHFERGTPDRALLKFRHTIPLSL